MTAQEFTISAGDLDAGGRSYLFPVRAPWMRAALEDHEATAAGPEGKLEVRASKSGSDVVVHGTLRASLSIPCARCLESVTVEIEEPVSLLVVIQAALPSKGSVSEEDEILAGEADTLAYDGETVVLDDFVRDELILQTPKFPLCSEDCPGMSPSLPLQDRTSAPDRPIDPRLLPLLRLKNDKE
jgi:uncharacterized protein